jgi:hypothetical protein
MRTAVDTFRDAFEREPFPYQEEVLLEERDSLILKGRQVGMSTTLAALALHVATTEKGALVTIISPSMRQSIEVAEKARLGAWQLGATLLADSTTMTKFSNGSRIMSLAGTPRAARGYSARLLIIDEAAFVDRLTMDAARPTTAATGGRTILSSTPGNPVGFFFDEVMGSDPKWHRMTIRSEECPTITQDFLDRERASMDAETFAMEYEATFATSVSGVKFWEESDFYGAIDDNVPTLDERLKQLKERE